MSSADSQTYFFSAAELKALALRFRQQTDIPAELYEFTAFVQRYIYQCMTIDEAERFFSDR